MLVPRRCHCWSPRRTVLEAAQQQYTALIAGLAAALTEPELHEFREEWLREAVLLLLRAVVDTFPSLCTGPARSETERNLLLALIYLMGRLPGEPDLVPSAAAAAAGQTVHW